MKIPKAIWIVVLWILILAGFLFYQQGRLTKGHDIWVKPAPVDPRDLFRGDYVIFSYDFSRYHLKQPPPAGYPGNINEVYAILSNQNGDYYELDYFSIQKPEDTNIIYLKGKTLERLQEGATITYNIESYFVPEGEGKEYENYIGNDLLVNIHINPDGEATIIKTNLKELKKRGNS